MPRPFLAMLLCSVSSHAVITPISDDFSTATNTFPNWMDIGSTPTVIVHDGFSAKDWNDGDPTTNIANYTVGMEITGDGLRNDGGLILDTQNAIVGDEAIALDIGGTMQEDETIVFSCGLYNDNTNHIFLKPQLWNKTDNQLLAEPSPPLLIWNYDKNEYAPVNFDLEYTVAKDDIGDTLQIRFLEQFWDWDGRPAGDIFVDNFAVTSSIPPPPVLYAYEGFDGTLGARVDQTGATGSGFTLADTNFRMVYKAGLEYMDDQGNSLLTSGNSAGLAETAGGTKNLQLSMNALSNGTIFASYLLNFQEGDSWGMMTGLQSAPVGESANPITTIAAGFRSTSSNFGTYSDPIIAGIDVRTGPDSSPYALSDILVVMKVDLDGGGLTVWLNPTDLQDVTGSATDTITGTGSGFGNLTSVLFSLGSDEVASIDEVRIGNSIAAVVPMASGLDSMYASWASGFALSGTNANSTANPDGDLLNNLYEFGLGGDPTNSGDTGYGSVYGIEERGGTNWLYFIHPENNDAALAGLNYFLETNTNLVSGAGWTNTGYQVLGTATNGFGTGFNAVTNRISTEDESKQFLRLQIDGL